jgi:hypothetical protein
MSLHKINDLMRKYALKRSVIKNAHHGKAYMSAFIIDKSYRVLFCGNK